MKKRILVFAILFSTLNACATQQLMDQPRIFQYPGLTKAKLYEKSLQWIAYQFRSAQAVIQYQNAAEGKIISKVILDANMAGLYRNVITIEVKAGRARIFCKPIGYISPDGRAEFGLNEAMNNVMNELITYTYDEYDKFMQSDSGNKDW